MKNISLLLFFALPFATLAQKQEFTDVKGILERSIEYIQNDDRDKARIELEKIPHYDSTYETAALELSSIYINLKDWDKALGYCNWGIAHKGKNEHLFYQNRGACYSGMERYEDAFASNAAGLKQFPEYVPLKFNNALYLKKKKDVAKAKLVLEEIVRSNPFYASAHVELALLAMQENETARAMMCFNTYLLCINDFDKGNSVLSLMEKYVSSKKDSIPLGLFENDPDNYDKINLLLNNYLALDNGYKTGSKAGFATIKQDHLLFEQLSKQSAKTDGLWSSFYAPLFAEMFRAGQFVNYTYYLLQFSASDEHKKLAAKQAGAIDKFRSWLGDYYDKNWRMKKDEGSGKDVLRVYHDNDIIKRTGEFNFQTSEANGTWSYYFTNGRLSAIGPMKKNEQEGAWTWYRTSGNKESEANMKTSKIDGLLTIYYDNGNLKSKTNFKDGEKDGETREYYFNGKLKSILNYKAGKLDGSFRKYHVTGTISDSLNYVDGKVDGPYHYFYPNGEPSTIGAAKDDKRNGSVKEFYNDGQLESEYTYKDGELVGQGKEYFQNGKVSYEGEFKEGKKVGVHVSYNVDGSKYYEAHFDEDGKENGKRTYFDWEGRPHEIHDFTKGLIVAYQFLDKDGKVVSEAKKKGSEFEYRNIYFDGTPNASGLYNIKGGKEGEWKFNNNDGVLASVRNYKQNDPEGKQTYYHPNGKVSRTYEVIDGEYEGEYLEYYPDGTLEENGRYSKGEFEGQWFKYNEDGSLASMNYYVHGDQRYRVEYTVGGKVNNELYYVDGMIDYVVDYDELGDISDTLHLKAGGDGRLEHRFANGKPMVDGQYLLGKRHGEFKFLEFDGRVSAQGRYEFGNKHGKWIYNHLNGKKSEELSYNYEDRQGPYKRWDWFGNIKTEGEYAFDKAVGVWKNYYPNGKVEVLTEYLNGEVHGKKEFYAPTGDLQMVRYYDHGVLTSYSYLGPDGKLKQPIKINRMKDELTAYFPNGKVSRKYSMKNGLIEGELLEYAPNGTVTYSANFLGDEQDGLEKDVNEDGSIYSETNNQYATEHGMKTFYWPNGNKRLELPYVLDDLHGTGFEYDQKGKKLIEYTFVNDRLVNEKKL